MSGDRDDREEEGGEPSFKVIDRRRFASDGTERTEEERAATTVGATDDDASSSTAAPDPAPAPSPPPAPDPAYGREPEPGLGAPQGEPYDGTAADATQPSFATLLFSLSTQALMCLGEIAEAPGVEPRQDLPAARNIIDLLGVLEQKTKGNLTEDESALLERILYDLRMRFVQLSGPAE